MALKTILVALSTVRDGKRVRFAAGSVVSLTADEQDSLQKLQDQTGKLHFRTPVNEGGKAVESKPEAVDNGGGAAFEGAKVPMADKTVAQLKAYLDHNKVSYANNASKADLLKLGETHVATGGAGARDGEDDELTGATAKAYLDENSVEYAADADDDTLIAAAKAHKADPDAGL